LRAFVIVRVSSPSSSLAMFARDDELTASGRFAGGMLVDEVLVVIAVCSCCGVGRLVYIQTRKAQIIQRG
jgi:hypothetical protein